MKTIHVLLLVPISLSDELRDEYVFAPKSLVINFKAYRVFLLYLCYFNLSKLTCSLYTNKEILYCVT